MSRMDRRQFLQSGMVAGAACMSLRAFGQDAAESTAANLFPFPRAGSVSPRTSSSIESSPLSVGFETLDRQHFDPTKTYEHLARLGVKWARCQTGWNRCEAERGVYTFGWLDDVVDSLLEIGIQPWFNLGYGNPIYFPACEDPAAVGWAPVYGEGVMEAWIAFTCALAEHFRSRVRHWEIWNEPNIVGFWKPEKPDAEAYVRMVRKTVPVIRERVQDAFIIGGAFAGIPKGYMTACMDAGLAQHIDALSYHPYRAVPEAKYADEVAFMRGLLDGQRPGIMLWQGENGCPSVGGETSTGALSTLEWDETRQAKWVLRRLITDLSLGVDLTSYYHTVDLVGYRGKTNFKGLLRGTEYSPKPAYTAMQHVCALFDAGTQRANLSIEAAGQTGLPLQTAHFVRDGRAMHAYWVAANLQEGWTPETVTMRVTESPEARIEKPVLVNMLDGNGYALEAAAREGNAIQFTGLPLLDYPLLITDASLVV